MSQLILWDLQFRLNLLNLFRQLHRHLSDQLLRLVLLFRLYQCYLYFQSVQFHQLYLLSL